MRLSSLIGVPLCIIANQIHAQDFGISINLQIIPCEGAILNCPGSYGLAKNIGLFWDATNGYDCGFDGDADAHFEQRIAPAGCGLIAEARSVMSHQACDSGLDLYSLAYITGSDPWGGWQLQLENYIDMSDGSVDTRGPTGNFTAYLNAEGFIGYITEGGCAEYDYEITFGLDGFVDVLRPVMTYVVIDVIDGTGTSVFRRIIGKYKMPQGEMLLELQAGQNGESSAIGFGTTPEGEYLVGSKIVHVDEETLDINVDGRVTWEDVIALDAIVGTIDATLPVNVSKWDFDDSGEIDNADVEAIEEVLESGLASGFLGDTNNDGVVNCDDAQAIRDAILNSDDLFDAVVIGDPLYNVRLDADLDGIVDSADEAAVRSVLLPADLTGDWNVDFDDYLMILGLVGTCPGSVPGCPGDIADDFGTPGGDGEVSFGDILYLNAQLGC